MTKRYSDDPATATAAHPAIEAVFRPFDVPERFTLLKPLGRGGQGSVWLAEDRTLDQRIALKVIDLEAKERTVKEARVGRDLDHPNLIRIFDLIEQPDRLILVMEWLRGGTVKDMLHDGPLAVEQVISVAEQVLEALAYLHDRGIVHRDVKPSNLMRESSGRIKLGDLGLVRELDRTDDMTRSGLALGTPDYMSPEQLQGEKPAPPTDLYALGATLYELLVGARPFSGSSDLEIANHHLGSPIPQVRTHRPDCPRWLAAFIARLLEKKPHDRWSDGRAALHAFRSRRAPRWRLWRKRATVTLVVVALSATTVLTIDRLRPKLDNAVVDGEDLIGLDGKGREIWRATLGEQITAPLVADLTGSPGLEAAVGLRVRDNDTGLRRGEIAIIGSDGIQLSRFTPDLTQLQRWYPDFTAELQVSPTLTGDLDGDHRPDLVWTANHPSWYPMIIGIWWGHKGGTNQPIMVNSGWIQNMAVGDVDGDEKPEIVVAAFNNPLGFQDVVAVIDPGRTMLSPDLLPHDLERSQHVYVPLGPHDGRISIEGINDGILSLRQENNDFTINMLDPFDAKNQAPGSFEYRHFWQQVIALCRDAAAQPSVASRELDKLELEFSPILQSPGPQLALDMLYARSLARAGAHQEAILFLEEVADRFSNIPDPWLRLGEYNLIAGNRAAGQEAIRRSMVSRTIGRNPYDAMLFLTLDAALHVSAPDLETARSFWMSYTRERGEPLHFAALETVAHFFAGRWDEIDPEPENQGYYRPVEVVGLWGQFERGEDPALVAAEAARLASNPEIAPPAHLLRALILLKSEHIDEATTLAREALREIETRGREHFEFFIWVPVAEWVYAKTLEASGEIGLAREHFTRAEHIAPNAWFAQ